MNSKVSIIVGLYNVASFLKQKQLSCILNQTYSNWELLLVDDGSTDETSLLCDLFAEKDARIKVFHKENGGLGSARNVGIEQATGDYLWFYDVDDEVEFNLLEVCVHEMETRKVDLMIFGFWATTPFQNLTEEVHFTEKEIRGQQQLRDCYLDDLLFVRYGNGFAWNKMYRRSFVEQNHLRYENQRIQQDEVFNLKVYQEVNSIYLSPNIFYHYYIYNTGNTRSRFIPNRFEIYKSIYNHFLKLQELWNIQDSRFDEFLCRRFYSNILQSLTFNLFHKDCTWNHVEKIKVFNIILSDDITIKTVHKIKGLDISIEDNLYIRALELKSFILLRFLYESFKYARKVKKMIYAKKNLFLF